MTQNKRLLIIFLIISVSFNVFFILGYARSRHVVNMLKTPEGRTNFVAKKLKLTKDQKRIFIQLAKEFMTEKFQFKKDYSKEIETFWQEMLKSKPDFQKISAGLELRLTLDRKLQPLQQDFLQKLLKILTPEQRTLYVKLLRRNKHQSYK